MDEKNVSKVCCNCPYYKGDMTPEQRSLSLILKELAALRKAVETATAKEEREWQT